MIKRIAGVVLVFIATAAAWAILGTTVAVRTNMQDGSLRSEVGQLWGAPQRQKAPSVSYETLKPTSRPAVVSTVAPNGIGSGSGGGSAPTAVPAVPSDRIKNEVPLESSAVDVALDLEHRSKGLLWYSTYRVQFAGAYEIANHTTEAHDYQVAFTFPTEGAIYDNFRFAIGGKELEDLRVASSTVVGMVRLEPGQRERIEIGYGSQGLDQWWYDFGSNVSQAKNFALTMRTNFDEINFPSNAISPTAKAQENGGWRLEWRYANLLSGVQIGMEMPQRLNPGPWVSQISFFAPISLFFFFFVLFMFSTMQRVNIHPMNYFFIGTGFFSFHLLLAYLVDHVSIHVAFAICSVVSLLLVITYMRLVVGHRFAIFQVGIAQFVYLVLFSYTFFFEKYTGLAITILSIVTLSIVMQMTGRLDWSRIGEPTPEKIEPQGTQTSAVEA
jgi:hypothetical protein